MAQPRLRAPRPRQAPAPRRSLCDASSSMVALMLLLLLAFVLDVTTNLSNLLVDFGQLGSTALSRALASWSTCAPTPNCDQV